MTSAARNVLATLALVVGTLALVAAPSTAAPAKQAAEPTPCHSISSGYKSWVSFQVENIECTHAHNVGRSWSGQCGRSSSTVTPMHCQVTETIGGVASTFSCANTKASQSPSHYHVHCHDPHGRKVWFTFFPYGF